MQPDETLYNCLFGRDKRCTGGGSIAHWLAYLLLDPAASSSIPSILKRISEEEIFDFAEVNQQRGLEVIWSVALKMLNESIYYWLVAS